MRVLNYKLTNEDKYLVQCSPVDHSGTRAMNFMFDVVITIAIAVGLYSYSHLPWVLTVVSIAYGLLLITMIMGVYGLSKKVDDRRLVDTNEIICKNYSAIGWPFFNLTSVLVSGFTVLATALISYLALAFDHGMILVGIMVALFVTHHIGMYLRGKLFIRTLRYLHEDVEGAEAPADYLA